MTAPHVLINAISLTPQGGGRSYVRNLLRELNRNARGFDFSILAAAGALSAEEAGRFEILEVDLPGRGMARTLARVAYEEAVLPLRARSFDALYCLADLAPIYCPTPTVVALRNLNIYDRRFYDTPRTRSLFRLVKMGLRGAEQIVCPTAAAAETIASMVGLPSERITVVHHGIDLAAFETAAEPIESDRSYLFFPANLERHKNIELIFDALEEVRDPQLELWLAGGEDLDPEWAEHLRQLVGERGLSERVRFLGPVPYQDVLRYYRGAVALVFPSHLETFGHPLLEAMLCETPIVASELASFREIASDIPLYFDAKDAKTLARAIDETIADETATQARVARGAIRARDFTWTRSIDGLCDALGRAIAR